MSFSDPMESKIPSSDKYWITALNNTSVKSPYEIKFSLVNQPDNEAEIWAWMKETFGSSGVKYKITASYVYAEIFFKSTADVTMFVLKWGSSFT